MRIRGGYRLIFIEDLLSMDARSILEVFRKISACVLAGGDAFLLSEPVRLTVWLNSRRVWRVAGVASIVLGQGCMDLPGNMHVRLMDDAWGEALRLHAVYAPGSRGKPLELAVKAGYAESNNARCILGVGEAPPRLRTVLWDDCRGCRIVKGTASSRFPLHIPINSLVGIRLEACLCGEPPSGWEPILEVGDTPLVLLEPLGRGISIQGLLKDERRDMVLGMLALSWACGE